MPHFFRQQLRAVLRIRTRITTEDLYELIGRPLPVTKPRFIVKPAGVALFHVVGSRTGKACGNRYGESVEIAPNGMYLSDHPEGVIEHSYKELRDQANPW